uniref:Thymidine phosphorylase n=1 Tax=Guillardia theta TaxID=55529 RepID=A0A6U6DNP1_GUITH|mmetsp:Transcript_7041/g.24541  ORF Transcript_7041/g.24541 Transcript_7041/m.24541 type:complete len:466 (+) Transcript_7041:197-1594(+)
MRENGTMNGSLHDQEKVFSAVELIMKKRDGHVLTEEEIRFFVFEFHQSKIPDYQMTALLMAIYLKGMTSEEIFHLTMAFMDTGKVSDLSFLGMHTADKHSTGGVGDKISIPLAPLVASCGVAVPMISGRGLGHTGGTLDKLESIPNLKTSLSTQEVYDQLSKIHVVITGANADIAPVDKRVYSLRDVTGTTSSLPLIASSIMSKKLSEGTDSLLLDVKAGKGAFLQDMEATKRLAETLVSAGKAAGRNAMAIITNMDQPLGNTVGNWLEMRESIDILNGKGPSDVRELVIVQCALMLLLAGRVKTYQEGRAMAELKIENGEGLQKFKQMIEAQGGSSMYIDAPESYPKPKHSLAVLSDHDGWIKAIDAFEVGLINNKLGGGRETLDSKIDFKAGLVFHFKVGDHVKAGEALVTLFTDGTYPDYLSDRTLKVFTIVPEPVAAPPLIDSIIVDGSSTSWEEYLKLSC